MSDGLFTHDLTLAGDSLSLCDQEWVLANGTGAFAMGTLPGIHTRRYHAYLVATPHPPVGRLAILNQVVEQVVIPGRPEPLQFNACRFRGRDGQATLHPRGVDHLVEFRRGATVAWTYRARGLEWTRRLVLHWRQQAATLRYTLRRQPGGPDGRLTLRLGPMVTLRDFHSLLRRDAAGPVEVVAHPERRDALRVRRGEVVASLVAAGTRVTAEPTWWYDFLYEADQARGQDHVEDAFVCGWFEAELPAGRDEISVDLTAALGEAAVAGDFEQAASARHAHLGPLVQRMGDLTHVPGLRDMDLTALLAIAADDFVVQRRFAGRDLATVIAGYPWFADWGRDTFISLPGLMLTTRRFDEARATLEAFASVIQDGLVPNRFDDYQDTAAHYNTVDASLWFVHAALEYLRLSGDRTAADAWLIPAVISVLDAYIKGTAHDIRMTGDCLITAGSPRTQLTWMDAARDGVIFTPRHGKAVEINALWYHVLLATSEHLQAGQPRLADHYQRLAARIGRSFVRVFWNDAQACLFDHIAVDPDGRERPDASVRPNQVLAVSLPHSPLPRSRQQQVLETVRTRLLTPYGLRTLPEDDPCYHPHYRGSLRERDEAYHQGTVWPWLIGPYAEAVLRVGRFSPAAKKQAVEALLPLLEYALGPGLGHLREIHEAAPPHRPEGAVAQAWSMAEVIRVLGLIAEGQG